jgi:hypothetical protein
MKILTTAPQCEDFATFRFGSTIAINHTGNAARFIAGPVMRQLEKQYS